MHVFRCLIMGLQRPGCTLMNNFFGWVEPAHSASPKSAQDRQQVVGADGVWAAPSCVKETSLFQTLLCGAVQGLKLWQDHAERQMGMAMAGGRWFHFPFGLKLF